MISTAQLLASAALGACIGYVTNAVAIRSLFRPLRRRWFTLGWQGVIPRNRRRLADNIARVVGEDLLGRDYLSAQLQDPRVRQRLECLLDTRLEDLLGRTPAELWAQLPPDWRTHGLGQGWEHLFSLVVDWFHSAAGGETRTRLLDAVETHMRELQVGRMLSAEDAAGLFRSLVEVLETTSARAAVKELLREQAEVLLSRDTSLAELLPREIRTALHAHLRELMPLVLRRVAAWLATAENAEEMAARLLAALGRHARQEQGWGALVGEMTLRLFGEQLRDAIGARLPTIAQEYLHSPEVRARVEGHLFVAVDALLQRPLGQILGPRREILVAHMAELGGAWITDTRMQQQLQTLLETQYQRHLELRLGELLPDHVWPLLRARLEEAWCVDRRQRHVWGRALGRWVAKQVRCSSRPLGSWLGIGGSERRALARQLAETGVEMLRAQAPVLVRQLDVAGMVHRRVMNYDLLEVEQLVKSIISDQFRHINLLGALLGGLVGLLLPLLNAYLQAVGL